MHKDLHDICQFDQYLHTLRKNGTNTSAICVRLTNTYTLWVKGAQRLLRNMCKFDQYLHTLRKNVTNTSAICVSLTNTYTLWVKGVQRFSQYV